MSALTTEARLERLEAAHELANLIGRYAFYMHGAKHEELVGLFARCRRGRRPRPHERAADLGGMASTAQVEAALLKALATS